MKMYVQYRDKSCGCIPDEDLEGMIKDGSIVAFRRSDDWVETSSDAIRGKGGQTEYTGPERRRMGKQLNCLTCPDLFGSTCVTTGYCPVRNSLLAKNQ